MMAKSMKLCTVEEMPDDFHEIGIVRGYRRSESTVLDCLRSLFAWHNETLNVWTHLLSFGFFLWNAISISRIMDLTLPDHQPLLGLLVSSCLFPLGSVTAHLFNNVSAVARHVCFMVDYMAISIYAYGSCLANRAYSFPSDWQGTSFESYFLTGSFVNCVGAVILSSHSRFMKTGAQTKMFRLSAFAFPYLFGMLPCLYRVAFSHELVQSSSVFFYRLHFLGMIVSVIFYASHLPEVKFRGVFDIVGHSHQWFHIGVVFSVKSFIDGILLDISVNHARLKSSVHLPLLSLFLLAVINTLTVVLFGYRMHLVKTSKLK